MTDIFNEVEADLRREKVESLWRRFGGYVLLVAILVVVGVAGWRGYEGWATAREREAGERYLALIAEADAVRTASPAEALVAFAADAPGDFGVLARLRAATAFEQADDAARAEETLRAVADDAAVPGTYRDVARIRLAQVLLDAGNTAGARDVLAPMATDAGNPFSRTAQELVGVAAYADGDLETARARFTALSEDVQTTQGMRQRAQAMVGLIEQVSPATPQAGEGADAAPGGTTDAAAGAAAAGTGEAAAQTAPAQETN